MKLIHSDPAHFIQSRLERLASGRRRRRLQRREDAPAPGSSPPGSSPPGSSPPGSSPRGSSPRGSSPRGSSPKKAA